MERELALVLYGATGFTGKLVAEHLAALPLLVHDSLDQGRISVLLPGERADGAGP